MFSNNGCNVATHGHSTSVSSGWEGSTSDAGVLKSAIQTGFHVPRGKFYLVDGGYANTPNFLAPYQESDTIYKNKDVAIVDQRITSSYLIFVMPSYAITLSVRLEFSRRGFPN